MIWPMMKSGLGIRCGSHRSLPNQRPQNSAGNSAHGERQPSSFRQIFKLNSKHRTQTKMSQFDNQSPRSKRRKLDTPQGPNSGASITSHAQLRTLLVFSQNVAESKQGEYLTQH